MADFILLMHGDAEQPERAEDWDGYIAGLIARSAFAGGSAMGGGLRLRKGHADVPLTGDLTGFMRIRAPDLTAARDLLIGNPVYEAGGTVEIRELPET